MRFTKLVLLSTLLVAAAATSAVAQCSNNRDIYTVPLTHPINATQWQRDIIVNNPPNSGVAMTVNITASRHGGIAPSPTATCSAAITGMWSSPVSTPDFCFNATLAVGETYTYSVPDTWLPLGTTGVVQITVTPANFASTVDASVHVEDTLQVTMTLPPTAGGGTISDTRHRWFQVASVCP